MIKETIIISSRAKLFGGKGLDVLQSKLEPFEDFLVRLLQKPNLKKSDLLLGVNDTPVFLLNEYIVELNPASFNILNQILN